MSFHLPDHDGEAQGYGHGDLLRVVEAQRRTAVGGALVVALLALGQHAGVQLEVPHVHLRETSDIKTRFRAAVGSRGFAEAGRLGDKHLYGVWCGIFGHQK